MEQMEQLLRSDCPRPIL